MIIIDQLFRFGHAITALYTWILFLIDQVYDFGYFVLMALNSLIHIFIDVLYHVGHYSITVLSSWFQILIGIIVGFLIANLLLSISSATFSQSAEKNYCNQPFTSEHASIDSFIESIERCPRLHKPKPKSKPTIAELDLWAQEVQHQAEDANSNISNEIDDDPGETSLFAEDYISESEHNKALASLNYQIGGLIKHISKRDQLLKKSRGEIIHAETRIGELREEIKRLEIEIVQDKDVIEDLQVSHSEKDKLIDELRTQLFSQIYGLPLEEMKPLSLSGQEELSSEHVIAPSESKPKAKDIMTYIPPNRRSVSQV